MTGGPEDPPIPMNAGGPSDTPPNSSPPVFRTGAIPQPCMMVLEHLHNQLISARQMIDQNTTEFRTYYGRLETAFGELKTRLEARFEADERRVEALVTELKAMQQWRHGLEPQHTELMDALIEVKDMVKARKFWQDTRSRVLQNTMLFVVTLAVGWIIWRLTGWTPPNH